MWFEILPSFAIVVACLYMPQVTSYAINKIFIGNTYKRSFDMFDDTRHYLRDMRVSGTNNAYKQMNLDCLEPEPETNENAQKKECPP